MGSIRDMRDPFFGFQEKLQNNSAKGLAGVSPMRIMRFPDEAGPRRISKPLAVLDAV